MKPVFVCFLFVFIFFMNCCDNDDFPVEEIPGFYQYCFVIIHGYNGNFIYEGNSSVTVSKKNDTYDINFEPIVVDTFRGIGDTIADIPNIIIPTLTVKITDFSFSNAYFNFPKTGEFEHGTPYAGQRDFFSTYGAAEMTLRLNLKCTNTEKSYFLIIEASRFSEK